MKRCTYCGKEYPEDVALCPLDQNAVTIDGKPLSPQTPRAKREPARARTPSEVRAHFAARPMCVKIGIGVLAFASLLDVLRQIVLLRHHAPHDPLFYVSALWPEGFSIVIVFFAFRGNNWARWLIVCAIILGSIEPLWSHYRLPPSFYFYYLLDFIGLIALFQRASNEWFSKSKVTDEAQAI